MWEDGGGEKQLPGQLEPSSLLFSFFFFLFFSFLSFLFPLLSLVEGEEGGGGGGGGRSSCVFGLIRGMLRGRLLRGDGGRGRLTPTKLTRAAAAAAAAPVAPAAPAASASATAAAAAAADSPLQQTSSPGGEAVNGGLAMPGGLAPGSEPREDGGRGQRFSRSEQNLSPFSLSLLRLRFVSRIIAFSSLFQRIFQLVIFFFFLKFENPSSKKKNVSLKIQVGRGTSQIYWGIE